MTLYYEAIADLEAALISIAAFDDFPGFAGGEVEVLFAMGTIGLRSRCDGVGELLVAVPLQINRVETVQFMGCGSHPVGSWAGHRCCVGVGAFWFRTAAPCFNDCRIDWAAATRLGGFLIAHERSRG
jgi:hypothetical protein